MCVYVVQYWITPQLDEILVAELRRARLKYSVSKVGVQAQMS